MSLESSIADLITANNSLVQTVQNLLSAYGEGKLADGTVLTVGTGGDFATLNDAWSYALSKLCVGTLTLQINDGAYAWPEQILAGSPAPKVRIVGNLANRALVSLSNGAGNAMTICSSAEVELDGFSVAATNGFGLYVYRAFVQVKNFLAQNSVRGIFVENGGAVGLVNAKALNCQYGICAYQSGHIEAAADCVVEGCVNRGWDSSSGSINCPYTTAINCGIGYYTGDNGFMFALGTVAGCSGNTVNHSPAINGSEGNGFGVITFN